MIGDRDLVGEKTLTNFDPLTMLHSAKTFALISPSLMAGGGSGSRVRIVDRKPRQIKELYPKHHSHAGRVYDPNSIGRTLISSEGGVGKQTGLYEVGDRIRKLTPTECERLMGFPDGWTDGISDTQRYKCLGNSVVVPVVEYIARRLC